EGRDLAGRLGRDAGVAPEAQLALGGRDLDPAVGALDSEHRAGQPVLGPAAVGWRAEARVAVGAGPGATGEVDRIDSSVGLGLLVRDERAVDGSRAVDAGLPAGLPVGLVAGEEGQVHAGVAGGLDVG